MSADKYSSILESGETVPEMAPKPIGSQEWAYDNTYGKIDNSANLAGNSVVLDIMPDGATEPVMITSDITLAVHALQGSGYAVIYNIEHDDNVRVVEINLATKDPLILVKGDAYYYLNNGPDNLILRDDSIPDFQDGDEVQLTAIPSPPLQYPRYEQASRCRSHFYTDSACYSTPVLKKLRL